MRGMVKTLGLFGFYIWMCDPQSWISGFYKGLSLGRLAI